MFGNAQGSSKSCLSLTVMLRLPLIPSADESISGPRNASGTSEPLRICGEIQPVTPHPRSMVIHHVVWKCVWTFRASPASYGKSQPIAPHLAGNWTKTIFVQDGLKLFSPSNLPGSLPTEKTGPGQQTRRNRKAPKRGTGRGESPQKSDTSDGNTKRATTTATHDKTPTDCETRASQRRDEKHWARSGWGSMSLTSLGVF